VWIPTLATLGQGLFMPLSGYLEDRLGVRITILIGKYMDQTLFMPLSGYLEDRLGVRITILIGKHMDQTLFMPLSGYLEDRLGVRITILIAKSLGRSGGSGFCRVQWIRVLSDPMYPDPVGVPVDS
jgi:hypothetical protein